MHVYIHLFILYILAEYSFYFPLIFLLYYYVYIGMMYLHTRSPPIIHRDLKSQNIFITEPSANHFIAKIGMCVCIYVSICILLYVCYTPCTSI